MAEVKKFSPSPYFDDFEEEKNFLRVLFRPGYSVQTRELNQLQTILQDQIGIISDYALQNNARVIGGETNLVNKLPFIKLAVGTTLTFAPEVYEDATFVADNGVTGTIAFIIPAVGSDPTTFYVKYDSSSTDGESQVPDDNSTITVTFPDTSTEVLPLEFSVATGNAAAVTLNAGIFYINKNFVRTDNQLLLLNKYDTVISDEEISAGFYVTDSIEKPETDISLLDNATGTPNETAPGAHRYKSTVTLTLRADLTTDQLQSYTELLKIVFGGVAPKPRIDNEFAVLEQILAKRTYDESGDYIVDDFIVEVREHLNTNGNGGLYTLAQGGDESKLVLQFDKGLAYIRGYEVLTNGDALVNIDKARATNSASNAIIQTQYATALFCYNLVAYPILSANIRLKQGATIIGSAYVRGFEYFGTQVISSVTEDVYRLDLVNVAFNAGYSWSNVNAVDYDPTVSATYPFSAAVNTYEVDAREATLVYPLPYGFSQSINPQVSFFYKELSTTSVGTSVTISTGTTAESFDDETTSFVAYADYGGGFVGKPQSVTVVDAQNVILNIQNIVGTPTPGNVPVRVIAKTFCTAPVPRTKTLVSSFVNAGLTSAAKVTLTKADGFKLQSIVTSGGVNVTDSYTFDGGARDSFYDFASISLKPGQALPAGTLTVTFSYFEHAPAGDFFTPTSYVGVQYNEIPYYKTTSGTKIFLGSAIDFRQRRTSTNTLEKVGRHAFVTDDQVITDITYYMGRHDRAMLTKRGEFIVIAGEPSLNPQLPPEISDAITLYTMKVPPYTFKTNDVVTTKVDHRRFTMKDIRRIETRLSTVEEVTLLTSLERDIQNTDFQDRFKSGFVVDNFATSAAAEYADPLLKIAFDAVDPQIRPKNVSTFIDLDHVNSTGVTRHADGATTLAYTSKAAISQSLASSVVRLQPYALYDWVGVVTMNPASDIWFETQENINTSLTTFGASRIAPWIWHNWGTSDSTVTTTKNTFDNALLSGTWNFVGGVWRNQKTGAGASATQNDQLNGIAARTPGADTRITVSTDQVAIPYIRSRAVTFEAANLKPGTRVYPSFDGVDVSAHCTPATLITSGSGFVTGTFVIPAATFRTGSRVFKLSDNPDPKAEHISTVARFNYSASGTLIRETAAVTSTNKVWYDPVAQSFFVEESAAKGGMFVSSVDIYFGPGVSPATNRYAATVDIRPMVNGYPTRNPISQNASVTVQPSAIFGSNDSSVATRFTFPSPVYLPAGEEYSFVVQSQSETITIWCSELGKKAFRAGDTLSATGEIISKQPYLGSMFLSQNNSTWTADQLRDVKFVINRCVFGSSGAIVMNNRVPAASVNTQSNIHRRLLTNNPLYFTSASTTVYVEAWGHGFSVGDTVTLTKAGAAGVMYGVPVAEVFDTPKTITAVDVFGYSFAVTTPAIATGRHGGANTYSSWAIDYSYAQLISDDFVLEGTKIAYIVRGRSKDAYGAGVTGNFVVEPDNIIDLNAMYVTKASNDSGVQMIAVLQSAADNISPVIHEPRVGVNVISNVINNTPYANASNIVQDKSSPARYIQKQVSLINPANELKVFIEGNLPPGTSINAYYKVGQSSIAEQADWIRLPVDGALQYTSDPAKFFTQRFSNTFASEFQVFAIMIDLVSSDKTRVPRMKDYRALALNV